MVAPGLAEALQMREGIDEIALAIDHGKPEPALFNKFEVIGNQQLKQLRLPPPASGHGNQVLKASMERDSERKTGGEKIVKRGARKVQLHELLQCLVALLG